METDVPDGLVLLLYQRGKGKMNSGVRSQFIILLTFIVLCSMQLHSQIKPTVRAVGGDNVPALKQKIEKTLEAVLLEMNRLQKGTGNIEVIRRLFEPDAFSTFRQFIEETKPYTARKLNEPQMVQRQRGAFFDVRSIAVKVVLGETEASDMQNMLFTFSADGMISSVRTVLPQADYQSVLQAGVTEEDSLRRGLILDFIERFRTAYNTKNIELLEKVYSDDALIIVGTLIKAKQSPNEMLKKSFLSENKIRLVQQTKRQYLDNLREHAFRSRSFLNVRFDSLQIIRHKKAPHVYGVQCIQEWRTAKYYDRGYLFLMVDFRDANEPTIHVRTWQPKAFTEDGGFVTLYDFDIVGY